MDEAKKESNVSAQPRLKKELTYTTLLLIALNTIIASGVFFYPTSEITKNSSVMLIAWGIASALSIYIAMCFAELAGMFPCAGGIYEYCKQAYGHGWSFLIAWTALITSYLTIAMLIAGAIQALIPTHAPLIEIAISLFFVIALNILAYRGMKASTIMLITFAMITLAALALTILPSLTLTNPENVQFSFVFPVSILFITTAFIFRQFFGWESVTYLASETKNAERVVPKVLIHSTIIVAIFSLILIISALAIIPMQSDTQSGTLLSKIVNVLYGQETGTIFTILFYLSTLGAGACWIISTPRLLLSMAEDKLFLNQLARIHPEYKTPAHAIFFQTVVIILLVLFTSNTYTLLANMLLPLLLGVYGATVLSVGILRYKVPNKERPYICPAGKHGSFGIAAVFIIFLIIWLVTIAGAFYFLLLAACFVLLGIPLFFFLKLKYDPYAIMHLTDSFAVLSWILEKVFITKSVKKEMFEVLEGSDAGDILEYGCGVGTVTLDLAKRSEKSGKVYAVDLSRKSLHIAQKRAAWKGIKNIVFIHDIEQVKRVHDAVPHVNAIVSIGMFGYIQDLRKVLKEMHELLPDQGRVCFVDYADYFKLIPNAGWLSDIEALQEIWKECGFSVHVTKKKGIFWNYIFIVGIKSKETVPFI